MSQFQDLDRPPLRERELRAALIRPGSFWTSVEVLPEIGSTNVELTGRARLGAAEGAVLITEWQSAGRGRLGRIWTSPPRAGLTLSVLLRPAVPVTRFGGLPLVAGLALVDVVARPGGLHASLKWPNDLLIADRKCAGVLAEVADGAVILGIGLNVSLQPAELPRPDATSLAIEGAECVDRGPLVKRLLRALAARYEAWRLADGDLIESGLLAEYRDACSTLGRPVRVELPGGDVLAGTAVDVDPVGRLLVRHDEGRVSTVAAGDVIHVSS